jgi:hypothetical protein
MCHVSCSLAQSHACTLLPADCDNPFVLIVHADQMPCGSGQAFAIVAGPHHAAYITNGEYGHLETGICWAPQPINGTRCEALHHAVNRLFIRMHQRDD